MSDPAALQSPPARSIPGLSPTRQRRARLLFRWLTSISPALATRLAAWLFVRPRARSIGHEEQQFLRTASSRGLHSPVGGIQVYVWESAGPTVLVVHGWISHSARLRVLIEALRSQGLRVVAFDAPAHGRSSGRHADLFRFRAALAAVSEACGPIAAIVAHSFGALAAVTWMAEEPSAASVRAAVLVGLPRDVGYLFDSFTIALGLRADVVTRLRALFRARYGRDPEQFSALLLAHRLSIPMLLVHGSDDELVPSQHAYEIEHQLANGRVRVLSGLNHSAPLRDPQGVALIVQFVAAQLTSSCAQTTPDHEYSG